MAPTERLSLALLKMKVIKAFQELNAACVALDMDAAELAQRGMNAGLDTLSTRFRAHAR